MITRQFTAAAAISTVLLAVCTASARQPIPEKALQFAKPSTFAFLRFDVDQMDPKATYAWLATALHDATDADQQDGKTDGLKDPGERQKALDHFTMRAETIGTKTGPIITVKIKVAHEEGIRGPLAG